MPQKGLAYLVKATPLILVAIPHNRDVFVGDGPPESELKSLANSQDISSSCRFLGFGQDVPHLLSCYDIFALPSLWEGLSISLLEAMAAGKPIVTTNIKGNRELIKNVVDGPLVNPQNPESLADGCIYFFRHRDRAQAVGSKARRKAEASFSEEVMVRRTLELYF